MEIKSVIVLWICPTELLEKRIPIMCRCRGVKMEVQRFALDFGWEIFVLYRVINRLEIKFWVKYTLEASNFRDVIAQKMCWKVTFMRRFCNNLRTLRNFWMLLECFRKYTFRAWIWGQIFHYLAGNQECYCPSNMSYWITRKTDSNYVPMEEHNNGSLTILSRVRLGNIFPISRDQSSRKKNFAKKYVSG